MGSMHVPEDPSRAHDPATPAEPRPVPPGGWPLPASPRAGGSAGAAPLGSGPKGEVARAVDETLRVHLHDHLVRIERLLAGAGRRVARGEGLPAWLRETPGEARWPV